VRLDDMLKRRRVWRERYRALLADQPGVRILGGQDDAGDNCWLTPIVADPERSEGTAGALAAALEKADVETRPVWKPMHLQPVSQGLSGVIDGTSEAIFAHGLTLPAGSAMTDDQFGRIEDAIREVTTR